MKKARTVAAVLRSRARPRTQDDEHPAGALRPPAPGQEPVVRILHSDDNPGFSEVGPEQPGQQGYPDDTLKETAQLCLLGIAIALYLLALIFILF